MPHPETTELLVALERSIWQALMEGDGAKDSCLLSDDFRGVYATGLADKATHVAQVKSGPAIAWYELADPQVLQLAEGVVALTYHARFRRARQAHLALPESMYVTSIWRREADAWVNVFSQDTRCDPE